jgi:hypothetical protein
MKKGLLVTVSLSLSILFIGILALALSAGDAQASFESDEASNNVVELSPGTTKTTDPGQTISYTHVVTNIDDITHTFEVAVSAPSGWPVDLVTDQWTTGTAHLPFSLDPALTKTFAVSLTVPSMIPSGDFETVITVTSTSTDALAVATDTTTVNQIARVELSPAEDQSGLNPGEVVTYAHTITNTGEITDIFDLEATSSQSWTVELFRGNWPTGTQGTLRFEQLAPGATDTLTVSITVPSTATACSVDYTIITATSNFDSNAQDTVTDTTTLMSYIYLPLVLRNYPPIPEGSVTIVAENDYVYTQTVTLSLTATVEGDTVEQMCLSNSPTCSEWDPFEEEATWELESDISGLKTIYAIFRGEKGGVSDIVSDQIYLLRNGSFENNPNRSVWEENSNPLPVSFETSIVEKSDEYDASPADGDYAVLLGKTDYPCASDGVPLGYAAIEQDLKLPDNTQPLTLTFKYIVWSQDYSKNDNYDRFEVYINDNLKFANGNKVNKLDCSDWWRVPGTDNPRDEQTSGWAIGEIDLSDYAGETVTLSFRNYSRYDGWYNTYTYVDNIAIEGNW